MLLRLVIAGKPTAKGRARFNRKTGRTYTPETTVAYETKLALAAQEKMNGALPFACPLAVNVLAEMPIPTSWSKKKQEAARKGELMPTGKPDADNYGKILDGLNMVAWVDDAQIVDLRVRKRYSDQPQLTIEIDRALPLSDFFD